MTQDERSAAIDERRAEIAQVRREMRVNPSERLQRRLAMLEREESVLLAEYNAIEVAHAWRDK